MTSPRNSGRSLPRRSRSTIRPRPSGSWPTAIGPSPIGHQGPTSSCSRTSCPEANPTAEANAAAAAGLLLLTERLVGRPRALEAARLLTAFAHGFVSMELAGAFRLGGDVDEAYRFAIDSIVEGLGVTGRRG